MIMKSFITLNYLKILFLRIVEMSNYKSNITFLICKAHSEEKESIDPYVNILNDQGYDAHMVPSLEFEYHNLDVLKNKLQNPQDYSGLYLLLKYHYTLYQLVDSGF